MLLGDTLPACKHQPAAVGDERGSEALVSAPLVADCEALAATGSGAEMIAVGTGLRRSGFDPPPAQIPA
jgi:hypothetical protein